MVIKVISGGQTGADQGALIAARSLGIETGGFMPRGFLTEDGPRPEFAALYGMQEHHSERYPPRTRANVFASYGTAWFGALDSRGFTCTQAAVARYGKLFILNPTSRALASWVKDNGIRVLNVAGSRESKSEGIGRYVKELLVFALPLVGLEPDALKDDEFKYDER